MEHAMDLFSLIFAWNFLDCWWLAPLALLLDLAFADPKMPWPHPVCWIGWLYKRLEKAGRSLLASSLLSPPCHLAGQIFGRLVGLLCLLVIVFLTGGTVWLLVNLPLLGPLLAIYLAFSGLAMGSLVQAGREVLEVVESKPPAEGARALSRLVSRDTSGMDKPVLLKTLADTLAENFTDALVAPFFWLLVAGPVGLWCYKAVSTGDSMWGYKTEKWLLLGWAPARGDDLLAFVPARLSALLLWLADKVWPVRTWSGKWPGLGTIARQAKGMTSPNSGWSMTALAWLVRARMAGPSVYFGQLVHKEWLGPPPEQSLPWSASLIHVLLALLQRGSLIGGLGLCLVFWWVRVLV